MKTKTSTNTKTDRVLKLAKKAGFVIWDNCSWAGDRVGKVDWACEYDHELVKFYDLVRKDYEKEINNTDRKKS